MSNENKLLAIYLKEVRRFPVLTEQEEKHIARKIQNGDKEATDKLVEANLRYVVRIALKCKSQRLSVLDLINEGNLGLIEAAKRYDPDYGVRFMSYASWWIRQRISMAMASQNFAVKLPVEKLVFYKRIRSKELNCRQEFQRQVSANEIAYLLNEDESHVDQLIHATSTCISLDDVDNNDFLELRIQDFSRNGDEEKIATKIFISEIYSILDTLPPIEAEVLQLRYDFRNCNKKYTLSETGKRIGITKEGVRLIEKRAKLKLKKLCVR